MFIILSLAMLLTGPVIPGPGGTPSEVSAAETVAAVNTAYNGKSPYYIMVNRQMNTVTVYGVGDDGRYSVPLKAMVASCGRAGHSTPTGTFSTPDSRYTWRLMVDGTYGQYASRITGSILFHSICYTSANKSKMISSEYDLLGSLASRGCVRLQTIDAKWIYDNCPTGTLVTIYDSSIPGALGKPQRAVNSVSGMPSPYNTWDPTDPSPSNPWRLNISAVVTGSGSGTVSGAGAYRYGSSVSLTAVAGEHSAFNGWYDPDGHCISADPVCYLTVEREQQITASFRRLVYVKASASASGTASGGGDAEPSSSVTVSTLPRVQDGEKNAALIGWYDREGKLLSEDPVYTFKAENDIELYAMYEGDTYGDIPYNAWYGSEAAAAKEAGITTGMTPVIFGADLPYTRAMAVQMIARAAGADTSSAEGGKFQDLDEGAWYLGAVNWAWSKGIVQGISETEFAPDQPVTRQDMLVMICRYMSSLEQKETENETEQASEAAENTGSDLNYADAGDIAEYALSWFQFAQEHGLLKGYEDNTVRPLNILTRAEGTVLIMRMIRALDSQENTAAGSEQ